MVLTQPDGYAAQFKLALRRVPAVAAGARGAAAPAWYPRRVGTMKRRRASAIIQFRGLTKQDIAGVFIANCETIQENNPLKDLFHPGLGNYKGILVRECLRLAGIWVLYEWAVDHEVGDETNLLSEESRLCDEHPDKLFSWFTRPSLGEHANVKLLRNSTYTVDDITTAFESCEAMDSVLEEGASRDAPQEGVLGMDAPAAPSILSSIRPALSHSMAKVRRKGPKVDVEKKVNKSRANRRAIPTVLLATLGLAKCFSTRYCRVWTGLVMQGGVLVNMATSSNRIPNIRKSRPKQMLAVLGSKKLMRRKT